MQTKSVVDKTCGHGALPVGGFMATPIGAHVLSFCQKYPSAGRTSFPFNVFRQMLRKSHELGLLTGMKEVVLSLEEEIVFKHIKALDMPSSVSRGE